MVWGASKNESTLQFRGASCTFRPLAGSNSGVLLLVAKRLRGGHEGEVDVVAFRPGKKRLVHIETNMDSDSWATRETQFSRLALSLSAVRR
jgi:hypothetical protein